MATEPADTTAQNRQRLLVELVHYGGPKSTGQADDRRGGLSDSTIDPSRRRTMAIKRTAARRASLRDVYLMWH